MANSKKPLRRVRIEHDGSGKHAGTKVLDLATGEEVPCTVSEFHFISHYESGPLMFTQLRYLRDGEIAPAAELACECVIVAEFVWKGV